MDGKRNSRGWPKGRAFMGFFWSMCTELVERYSTVSYVLANPQSHGGRYLSLGGSGSSQGTGCFSLGFDLYRLFYIL